MPSEKVLSEKKEFVASIDQKLKASNSGVLVDYKGITVENDTKLRRDLRAAGVDYFVVKNTLLRFAAKQNGLDELTPFLEGTTAIALCGGDPIEASKILSKYAETSKGAFTIKGGFVDGKVVESAVVEKYAKLPAREVLIAQVLGGLNATISGLAVALNEIAKKKSA